NDDAALGNVTIVRVTVAPRVGVRAPFLSGEIEGELGVRLGVSRVDETPDLGLPSTTAPVHHDDAWGGPLLAFGGHFGTRVTAGFEAELGYAMIGSQGRLGGKTAVELAGPWLSASVLVGLSF